MKKFVLKNVVSLSFLGLIVMIAVVCVFKYSADESKKYIEVTVVEGDSLWQIAEKYNYDNIETNQFIAHLEKVNQLHSDLLQVGDVLLVPVNESEEKHLTMNTN